MSEKCEENVSHVIESIQQLCHRLDHSSSSDSILSDASVRSEMFERSWQPICNDEQNVSAIVNLNINASYDAS